MLVNNCSNVPIAITGSEIDKYGSKKRLKPDLPLRHLNPVISVSGISSLVALTSGEFCWKLFES